MMIEWIYLCDVGFNMITDIEQNVNGTDECIFDLKNGDEMENENAFKMIFKFDQNKKIIRFFKSSLNMTKKK